ncbi:MAG: thioesterase family protein [bacterium]
MTSFSSLMGQITSKGGFSVVTIPENWMQGRTTYGGLTAALMLADALKSHTDLPPLRSAQINFIGPVGGATKLKSEMLRRGKSVCFLQSSLYSEYGLAGRATFAFGASRPVEIERDFLPPVDIAPPQDTANYLPDGVGPQFLINYEAQLAKGALPGTGATDHDHYIWVRHKDKQAHDLPALIAIADMAPPAILALYSHIPMASSVTWMFNLLTANAKTQDGWWLLRSTTETAQNGYTSQNMYVWNRAGQPIIAGRQNMAIFA